MHQNASAYRLAMNRPHRPPRVKVRSAGLAKGRAKFARMDTRRRFLGVIRSRTFTRGQA